MIDIRIRANNNEVEYQKEVKNDVTNSDIALVIAELGRIKGMMQDEYNNSEPLISL